MTTHLLPMYCNDCWFVAHVLLWLAICYPYFIITAHLFQGILMTVCLLPCTLVTALFLPMSCNGCLFVSHVLQWLPFIVHVLQWLLNCCPCTVMTAHLFPMYYNNCSFVSQYSDCLSVVLFLPMSCNGFPCTVYLWLPFVAHILQCPLICCPCTLMTGHLFPLYCNTCPFVAHVL